MVNLAGLHEQLDDLQSHWQNVQRNARQSPGKHQHFVDAVRHPGDLDTADAEGCCPQQQIATTINNSKHLVC